MLVSFFSSNIPLYIEKIPWKNYVRLWKRNLKRRVSLKFVFEKIKFKVLHYIQHDFIRHFNSALGNLSGNSAEFVCLKVRGPSKRILLLL